MRRGGGANRSQRGILFCALVAAPACNLIVGFEARELCDDCSSAGGASAAGGSSATGGSSSTQPNETSGTGGATASGGSGGAPDAQAAAEGTTAGGSNSDEGGADDTTTSTGGGATEGVDSGGGSSTTGGGSGGTGDSSGGAGGSGTDSGSGGAGGTDTVSSSMGGDTTDGNAQTTGTSGGTGGDTSSTTTSAGGSTTVGGSGGTGGTAGTPSPCQPESTYEAGNGLGAYPASLMLGRNTSAHPWDFTWVEGDAVYVSALSSAGARVMDPTLLDDSGTHSPSVIATQGQSAYVAYGEFANDAAKVVMHVVTPATNDVVGQDDTGTLDGDAAPRVVGVALKGTTSDALVAAIHADGSGLLALFKNGEHDSSLSLPGPLDDLTVLDLGTRFAIAFIQDGSLHVSTVSDDLEDVGTANEVVDAAPLVSPLGSLSGAPMMDGGAALVWRQTYGVHLTTLDDDGTPDEVVQVSTGNDIFPRVDVVDGQLFVSWIDSNSETLYLRRVHSGMPGTAEEPLAVADAVADVSYGFAADHFLAKPTLGFVYSTDRLYLTVVTCEE